MSDGAWSVQRVVVAVSRRGRRGIRRIGPAWTNDVSGSRESPRAHFLVSDRLIFSDTARHSRTELIGLDKLPPWLMSHCPKAERPVFTDGALAEAGWQNGLCGSPARWHKSVQLRPRPHLSVYPTRFWLQDGPHPLHYRERADALLGLRRTPCRDAPGVAYGAEARDGHAAT